MEKEKRTTLSEEDLLKWREKMISVAKNNLLKDGELKPVTLIIGSLKDSPDIGMSAIPMNMESVESKNNDVRQIEEICLGNTIYGLLFLSEVWMATANKEDLESDDFIPPSERDDKTESLMCSFESVAGDKMTMFSLIRDDNNKIIDLVEQEYDTFTDFKGRFSNLLKGKV